ncbi:hypothetical protein [Gimesia maris]|uniref:baeRF3 domain-containing protein n=1 Tax=Gimesia maris TaxID=122 RepID=UPI00241FF58C|nr:hypothetical protein [Gimesia maris]
MKTLTHDELKSLTEWEKGPCVSIYLPRHQAVSELGKDSIELRNRLDEAETSLQQMGLGTAEATQFLKPARMLQNDPTFWKQGAAQGLCLLMAPDMFLQYDLPYQCSPMLSVAETFYLSPLFYKAYEDDRFDLLAICPNSVRMIRHQNGDFTEVELPENIPAHLDDFAGGIELEESLQYHTTSSGSQGGEFAGVQHGHGLTKEQHEKVLTDYYQFLARQFDQYLQDNAPPLVLVCAEKQQSLFRKHFHGSQLLPEGVTTSPDQLSARELVDLALPVAESCFQTSLHKAQEKFQNHMGTARISHQLEEILQSAEQGRVEALFAPLGSELWGHLPQDGELLQTHAQPESGDIALLNWAIRNTYRHGGTPFVIQPDDMPDQHSVLASFRW